MTTEQYLLNNRVEVFGEYGDTSQMEEFTTITYRAKK